MGKIGEQSLPLQQSRHGSGNRGSSWLFCEGCSVGVSRIAKELNFRCVFVVVLSLAVLLSGIFWILPFHARKSGFDAKEAVKLSATVKAHFRLQTPVSYLIQRIGMLEYDIFGEIGVPNTKVAILSLHQPVASNWSDVEFGVLSDPMNFPINSVSLSVLRSSLIEVFLQQINLTLTTSIFGQPSAFQILKFPEGITIIPAQSASIWQIPQILFNFTLNNSISEIEENFVQLKEQLKSGLHLRSYENVYVQITNKDGSTIAPLVTVQASVMSDLGILLPLRLRQLAQTITGSPAKNLGLDNSVFGRVKSISLSSYLKGTLDADPPTPSLAPSPEPSVSPYTAYSPSYSPAPSPDIHHSAPCFNCESASPSPSPESGPYHPFPPYSISPATNPPHPCPDIGSTISTSPSPTSTSSPIVSPAVSPIAATPNSPSISPGSPLSPAKEKGNENSMPISIAPSPSSLAVSSFYNEIWLSGFFGLLIFHLLLWSY